MTTTDTDALAARLEDALIGALRTERDDDEGGRAWVVAGFVDPADLSTAVLPIIAEEVRKAKAEALREAADSVHDNAASPYCLPCHRDDADLLHTIATEYETGDSDEHR